MSVTIDDKQMTNADKVRYGLSIGLTPQEISEMWGIPISQVHGVRWREGLAKPNKRTRQRLREERKAAKETKTQEQPQSSESKRDFWFQEGYRVGQWAPVRASDFSFMQRLGFLFGRDLVRK